MTLENQDNSNELTMTQSFRMQVIKKQVKEASKEQLEELVIKLSEDFFIYQNNAIKMIGKSMGVL